MVVGVLEITLAVPAFTLKEKRSVVKRILHRVRHAFYVGAAEVDDLDVPGSAVLGFVAVGNDRRVLESQLAKLEHFVDALEIAEITDAYKSFTHYNALHSD